MMKSESAYKQQESSEPWYKQFWPWFLIALPASVVVAGIVTLFIAIEKADSLVVKDYYKQGMGINRILAEDEVARRLGVAAALKVDAATGEIALVLSGTPDLATEDLQLRWIHPAQSEQDFTVTMKKTSASHYQGDLPLVIQGRWYLQLHSEVPEPWRLRTEITMIEQGAAEQVSAHF